MVMKPDQERLSIGPHVPTFKKTLGGLLDDFHTTVALARKVHLLDRQINHIAGTDVVDEDTAMSELLDQQIETLCEVAELAGQPIDADKLRHLVSAQTRAPDDAAPFQLSIEQISSEIH